MNHSSENKTRSLFDDSETIHFLFQISTHLMDYFRSKLFGKNRKGSSEAAAAAASSTSENQSDNGLTIEYFQTQFLLDCLMRTVYHPADQKELITMCYEQIADNQNDLRMLSDFEQQYTSDRALWWYLQDSFLYKILNFSLESQDIGNLFVFRKLLRDINSQMQQHRCSTPLHVYRSQLMPMELLSQWISSVGQCVVVNSFLSATVSQKVALTYLNSTQVSKENCERVLLEIDADPRITGSKPFVQVGSLNYSGDDNEVIFMFGSIFLINNITCGNDGLYTIEMTLYSDTDHEFKQIFDDIKKRYGDGELDLLTFAQILKDLDRFNEAEEYANRYLESLPADHDDAIRCYNLLGSVALARADFENSLNWYNKALEFRMRKSSRSVDPKLSETHENIGDVYWKQGNRKLFAYHSYIFGYI
jgi:tetratricopeptide (TPR) repeat protein